MNLIDLISKHPVPVTRFQRPYVIAEEIGRAHV